MVGGFNARTSRVTVNVGAIQEVVVGDVRKHANRLGQQMAMNCALHAPKHGTTFRLVRQQWSLKNPAAYFHTGVPAYLQWYLTVGCRAKHAIWVHEGTSHHTGSMFIPLNTYPGGGGIYSPGSPRRIRGRDGQRAQPWMQEQMYSTLLKKGYL